MTDFKEEFTRFTPAPAEASRRMAAALDATCRREEEERAVVEYIAKLPIGVAPAEFIVREARRLVEKYRAMAPGESL